MPVNKSALERYHIIDRCIADKKYPTAKKLAHEIERSLDDIISVSSVNKDIAQMKKMYSAPIEYDKLHDGYKYTEDGYSIRTSGLTYNEMNTLELSLSLLERLRGSRLFDQYEKSVNKLVIGNKLVQVLGKSHNEIIQIEDSVQVDSNKWLEIILNSIIERNCVTVNYQGFGRLEKNHEFSAYLLKEFRNRWYAIGYVKNAKSTIVLAVDRIINIKPCSGKYFTDETFKSSEYFKYSIGITQIHEAKPEKVTLSFKAEQKPYLITQPLHHSQKIIKDNSKTFQIQLEVYLSYELKMIILSYGNSVKVDGPAILKNDIKQIVGEMKKIYK